LYMNQQYFFDVYEKVEQGEGRKNKRTINFC
jgi:hypothetical protein